MRTVDCNVLLAQDNPDALVMAILCDFKGQAEQDVVNHIAFRLKTLLKDDEKQFSNYFIMLETLAENRDLQQQLKESKDMLTEVDVTRFASYQWGMEHGMERGLERGIERGQLQLAAQLLKQGIVDINTIAQMLKVPVDTLQEQLDTQVAESRGGKQ